MFSSISSNGSIIVKQNDPSSDLWYFISKPAFENEPVLENKPISESKPDFESKPTLENKPAFESKHSSHIPHSINNEMNPIGNYILLRDPNVPLEKTFEERVKSADKSKTQDISYPISEKVALEAENISAK